MNVTLAASAAPPAPGQKPRTLFLFTNQYPYGNVETYLATEAPYLARAFDKVHVQPMMGAPTRRSTPSNFEVANPFWTNSAERRRFFVRGLLNPTTWLHFLGEALRAVVVHRRAHPATFARVLLWALYKSALEQSATVRNAIEGTGARVAYSYWGHTPALAVPALAKAGIPTVVRYHRVDLYLHGGAEASWWHRNARYLPWHDAAARHTALSLFISNNGMQYFQDRWGRHLSSRARLVVARLGTLDKGLGPPRDDNDNALVLVSCSHIVPVKQVHLVAALAKAMAQLRPVVWHHFGAGESKELDEELAGRLPEHFTYRRWGWIHNTEILEFYKSNRVDLFVNLSRSEGVPVAIMEAASFGIPALATDVDGTSEIVIDGLSGMLCTLDEASKPDLLAQRVVAALAPGGSFEGADPRAIWQDRSNATTNYNALATMLLDLAETGI
jgi:colanic acid/amylovoran biosynthesis glycosyltransferase